MLVCFKVCSFKFWWYYGNVNEEGVFNLSPKHIVWKISIYRPLTDQGQGRLKQSFSKAKKIYRRKV